MDKKTLAALLAAASLAGAAADHVAPSLLNPYRIHAIDFRVDGQGLVHRAPSAHRGPLDGVSSGTCDDGLTIGADGGVVETDVQLRLQAEVAAAGSECTFTP